MSDSPVPAVTARERTLEGVRLLAPVSLFIAIYLATFLAVGYAAAELGFRAMYWIALASAAGATFFTVRVVEQGLWSIGFFVPPRLVAREWVLGMLFAACVVGACDLLIVVSSGLRHVAGAGVVWREIVIVFVPAAVHEEIVFRGYMFQRIRAWSRPTAIGATALLFSALHAGNGGVTPIALVNLTLAGVLLALAYERFERLWFPIGLHFAWNVLSGPILGYGVSGYASAGTLLRSVSSGPAWATGGAFGIEASAWMMPVEMVAIAVLSRSQRRAKRVACSG
jgi:membrane protease YdiL (CAAX protease family)